MTDSIRRTQIAFWILVTVLAFVDGWGMRSHYADDTLSYLDLGYAFLHADWRNAINAYWSRLYPVLLAFAVWPAGESATPEFACVNILIFFLALGSFEFLLAQFSRSLHGNKHYKLSRVNLYLAAYPIFVWATFQMNNVSRMTPDTLSMAALFASSALLIQIARGEQGWSAYALLGMSVGLGYLAKTVMLALGMALAATALLLSSGGKRTQILWTVAAAFITVGPFIAALSLKTGHLNIGQSGKLNYAWCVTRMEDRYLRWQGDTKSGHPLHPTRILMANATVCES
jgi:hypothetical protein